MRLKTYNPFYELLDNEFSTAWDANNSHPIEKTDDANRIYIDLPGVQKDDLRAIIENNKVIIEAERKGFVSRKFKQVLKVAPELDINNIDLQLIDGVLVVTLPIAKSVKPKKLTIR